MCKLFLALFIICSFSLSLTAQEKYRAVHWGLEHGLAQAEVYHMLKDVNGFLWVGTAGGLSRFDGSRFKNYYHDPAKSGTFNATNSGLGLVEDSLHNIWIGTNNGLFRYDIKADTFAQFLPKSALPLQGYMFPFWASNDELFCFEADTLIVSYNVVSFERKRIASVTPADKLTGAVFDASTNSIWVLKGEGGSYGGPPGGGLLQVSVATGKTKYYDWRCYKNIPGHNHAAEGMTYDRKRNCLWINSWEGLMQFTLDDNQFHYIGELNPFFADKDYGHWVGISLDLQGRVWLATNPKGIVIYDPSDHTVKFPFPDDEKLQKEISDFNFCIYHDRDGIMWSGFWFRKGIYQVLPFSPSVRQYKPDPTKANTLGAPLVFSFEKAGQGKFWIGSHDGIHIFDPQTESFQALREKDLPGVKGKELGVLSIDTLANIAYIMTIPNHEIHRMDMKTRSCEPVVFRDSTGREMGIDFSKIMMNCGQFGGETILGAQDTRGVSHLFAIRSNGIVATQVATLPKISFWFFGYSVPGEAMLFIKDLNNVSNLTFSLRANKWVRSPTVFDSIAWSHIAFNKKDRSYWVIVEKQLVHYSSDFRPIRTYTPADGLPDIDIYSVLPDTRGNIWFNTDRSIHQLNIETGVFSMLSENDGFQPQGFSTGPQLTMGTSGDIYLGGGIYGEGFVRISPGKYTNTPSVVYVQSLEVNDEPFALSVGVNNLQELSLSYFQNKVSVETGIIDYYSKGKSNIRYKMEELNENWQYEPANYTIRYDGLAPGKYLLLMQASNAANEFIGPVKSLAIIISPPWWKTWWAYVAYTLTFASLLWSFIYYRSQELRKRNILLEQNVEQRTKDLSQSLKELKATQTQLIQSEKMASLGELTAGIAHEIQNPLNFVNNFSEVNTELIRDLKSEIQKGNIEEVTSIANNLESNEEKIVHHGKRASDIVKGMLQHSRTSSGQKEQTDINALCDEYLRLSYHGLRAKDKSFNAKFETRLDPTLPKVNVVPQDIGRVILNLINNAFYAVTLRHSPAQIASGKSDDSYQPIVWVSTQQLNDKILISVRDNGPGIPDSIKEKIFQPFFTTKPAGQGTGLGLSLSYDIVKAHGGELMIKSKEGEGAEFIIELFV